jgi:hypothetical protein
LIAIALSPVPEKLELESEVRFEKGDTVIKVLQGVTEMKSK